LEAFCAAVRALLEITLFCCGLGRAMGAAPPAACPSGMGRPLESRAARSSVISDLPWLGSPSIKVDFAAGM
jgi:hypothetical protein